MELAVTVGGPVPRAVREGDELSARWLNSLLRVAISGRMVRVGPGLECRMDSSGVYIGLASGQRPPVFLARIDNAARESDGRAVYGFTELALPGEAADDARELDGGRTGDAVNVAEFERPKGLVDVGRCVWVTRRVWRTAESDAARSVYTIDHDPGGFWARLTSAAAVLEADGVTEANRWTYGFSEVRDSETGWETVTNGITGTGAVNDFEGASTSTRVGRQSVSDLPSSTVGATAAPTEADGTGLGAVVFMGERALAPDYDAWRAHFVWAMPGVTGACEEETTP